MLAMLENLHPVLTSVLALMVLSLWQSNSDICFIYFWYCIWLCSSSLQFFPFVHAVPFSFPGIICVGGDGIINEVRHGSFIYFCCFLYKSTIFLSHVVLFTAHPMASSFLELSIKVHTLDQLDNL